MIQLPGVVRVESNREHCRGCAGCETSDSGTRTVSMAKRSVSAVDAALALVLGVAATLGAFSMHPSWIPAVC